MLTQDFHWVDLKVNKRWVRNKSYANKRRYTQAYAGILRYTHAYPACKSRAAGDLTGDAKDLHLTPQRRRRSNPGGTRAAKRATT